VDFGTDRAFFILTLIDTRAIPQSLSSGFLGRIYRSRPGGSAEGGMCGVADGLPAFAETLEGAG
jgi:hypothetical protein